MAKDKSLGQKVKDLLKQSGRDDGFMRHWVAHGATELANMLLHGHPAPVYAGGTSPFETSKYEYVSGAEFAQPETDGPASNAPEMAKPTVESLLKPNDLEQGKSFTEKIMAQIEQAPDIDSPEMALEIEDD